MTLETIDVTYTGGNNGNQFAKFLHEHDMLKDGKTIDDYGHIAENIPHTQPNFKNWIKNDGFWEDFAYAVVETYKINLVV